MRYRLIKPDWGKPDVISGPNVLEGDNYSPEFLRQKNEAGYNVYYFPNHNSKPIDHPFLRGSDIDTFTWVFVDMDLKDGRYESCEEFFELLLQEPIQPNKVVFSGNGLHAYWRITDLTLEAYLDIQLRLIQKFQTDESIWTALQLMRLPGYNNTKSRDNLKFVTETAVHEETTTADNLRSVLPELSRDNSRKLEMHKRKLSGLEELEALDEESLEMPEKFLQQLEKSRKLQDLWGAEKGERSEADFHIATILYEKEYTKAEALAVMLNTNKALSKGPHRKSYAMNVVNSAYMTKAKHYVPSAAEKLAGGILNNKDKGKRKLYGPSYLDGMQHGWRTKEVLGLIGSPSAGKTSLTLDSFYNMIKNDPEDDGVFIFFSLEMGEEEILEQWQMLTSDEPHLAERFYVVSNEDEEGNARYLNLQDVYCFVKDTAKVSGRKVKAIAIDHVGVLNKAIDIKRKPDFGLARRDDLGYGNNRTMSDRELTKFIKSMAKELDIFIILQSQTTKEKAGEGDSPLGLGAAYGVAQFEWDMDYVMTIWQPLKRVRHKTELAVTAFQYVKNRYVHKKDRIKVYEAQVIFIDLDNGRFRYMTDEEYEEFTELEKEAKMLRKMAEKKESGSYRNPADTDKVKGIVRKVILHEVK